MGGISQGAGETDRAPTVGPLKSQRGRRAWEPQEGAGPVCCYPRWAGAGSGLPGQGPREGKGTQTAGGLQGGAGAGASGLLSVSCLQPLAPVTLHGLLWKPGQEVGSRCAHQTQPLGLGEGGTRDCCPVTPRRGHTEAGTQPAVPLFAYVVQCTHICKGLNLGSQPLPSAQESGMTVLSGVL